MELWCRLLWKGICPADYDMGNIKFESLAVSMTESEHELGASISTRNIPANRTPKCYDKLFPNEVEESVARTAGCHAFPLRAGCRQQKPSRTEEPGGTVHRMYEPSLLQIQICGFTFDNSSKDRLTPVHPFHLAEELNRFLSMLGRSSASVAATFCVPSSFM